MANRFYAVQHGDNYDWDYGSDDYMTALAMAEAATEDERLDGQEIRIATIDEEHSFCEAEEVIREGWRG